MILSSREAEWSELPVDFRKKFTRLTVPRFSDDEMEQLVLKTLEINKSPIILNSDFLDSSKVFDNKEISIFSLLLIGTTLLVSC